MMFSLNTNSIRSVLNKRSGKGLGPADLPKYAMDQFGLRAINYTTDLLKGAGPQDLAAIRDAGDRVGCACLMLSQSEPMLLAAKDDDQRIQAVDRMQRVVKAAGILGCNAVSLKIKSKDSDEAFDAAAYSMKQILAVADDAEMNVLIEPASGLTEDPDRLTELVKAIGGFRIGTLPDFQSAVESGDPVAYIKRLTPYASVVNASTLGFKDPEPSEDDAKDDIAPGGLEDLAAELESMMFDEPAPEHVGYDLNEIVAAVAAVGFDGNIALDYRGADDGTLGVLHSKDAIEAALEAAKE